MLKNYIITSWRAILKNKLYSFLNIIGLAIGLASFILIAHYVLDELSYDDWIKDAERIYRVDGDLKFGGSALILAVCSDPIGPTLKKDYPQVEQFVRFYQSGPKLVRKGTDFIREMNVVHADSTLMDVIPMEVIAGEKKHPLDGRDKVMISEKVAKKYFSGMPYDQIIGKTIETNDAAKYYTVSAVMKDMPRNSHFEADLIFTMLNVRYQWNNWLSNNLTTYVKFYKKINPADFNHHFNELVIKYAIPQAQQAGMQIKNIDDFEKAGNHLTYTLFPILDIHLRSNKVAEMGPNGNIQYVYIFSIVALFILLIACINFMNLATARSANRAKEVGVRKVLGTEKSSLIFQFLSESIIMAFISMVIGLCIAALMLHFFNDLSAKDYKINSLFTLPWNIGYVMLPVIVGLLAGLYPAFYLSSFKPIEVLKSKIQISGLKDHFRSYLVVFQFVTSILLIVSSIVIYRQLNFIQNTNVGFNKDQVLIIDGARALGTNTESFKNEVSGFTGVTGSTFTDFLPVSNSARNDNTYFKSSVPDAANGLDMQTWNVDENYIPLLGMEMIEGRNFQKDMKTDSSAVILNQAAADLLGYNKQHPLDQKLYGFDNANNPQPFNVIGVVKNFHFESLRQKVGPLAFFYGPYKRSIGFKVNAGKAKELLTQIETKWKSMASGAPFNYRFLNDSFDEMYRSEQRIGKVALAFSILAILIACLGLFGLASFMAEQRTKELGVRKVLGASMNSLFTLLSKDFVRLVLIAFVITVPLSWYLMNRWLQDFAYRIEIKWWMFALAGLISLFIALLTVSSQAIKASWANPIKSLRTE
jgi:putative ABC transport system permease protein